MGQAALCSACWYPGVSTRAGLGVKAFELPAEDVSKINVARKPFENADPGLQDHCTLYMVHQHL